MFLKDVGWQGVGWNHLVENKDKVGFCEYSNEPEIILTSWRTASFLRWTLLHKVGYCDTERVHVHMYVDNCFGGV